MALFPSLNEQIDLIQQGSEEIIPEAEAAASEETADFEPQEEEQKEESKEVEESKLLAELDNEFSIITYSRI